MSDLKVEEHNPETLGCIQLANRLAENRFQDQTPLDMEQVCTEPVWASNASSRGSAKIDCRPICRRCCPKHFPNRPPFGRNRSVQKSCVLPSAKARVQKKKLANRLAENGFQDQAPLWMEQVCTEPMSAPNASSQGS